MNPSDSQKVGSTLGIKGINPFDEAYGGTECGVKESNEEHKCC